MSTNCSMYKSAHEGAEEGCQNLRMWKTVDSVYSKRRGYQPTSKEE